MIDLDGELRNGNMIEFFKPLNKPVKIYAVCFILSRIDCADFILIKVYAAVEQHNACNILIQLKTSVPNMLVYPCRRIGSYVHMVAVEYLMRPFDLSLQVIGKAFCTLHEKNEVAEVP